MDIDRILQFRVPWSEGTAREVARLNQVIAITNLRRFRGCVSVAWHARG